MLCDRQLLSGRLGAGIGADGVRREDELLRVDLAQRIAHRRRFFGKDIERRPGDHLIIQSFESSRLP